MLTRSSERIYNPSRYTCHSCDHSQLVVCCHLDIYLSLLLSPQSTSCVLSCGHLSVIVVVTTVNQLCVVIWTFVCHHCCDNSCVLSVADNLSNPSGHFIWSTSKTVSVPIEKKNSNDQRQKCSQDSRHNGGPVRGPRSIPNTQQCCDGQSYFTGWGGINWSPMIQRDASLSDSYGLIAVVFPLCL